jgi:transcription elongation factor Elf1
METDGKCHLCGKVAEYECARCDELTCENCTVPFTIHNQIEEWRCNQCNDTIQVDITEEYWEEERVYKLIEELGYDGYLLHEELSKQLKKEKKSI